MKRTLPGGQYILADSNIHRYCIKPYPGWVGGGGRVPPSLYFFLWAFKYVAHKNFGDFSDTLPPLPKTISRVYSTGAVLVSRYSEKMKI